MNKLKAHNLKKAARSFFKDYPQFSSVAIKEYFLEVDGEELPFELHGSKAKLSEETQGWLIEKSLTTRDTEKLISSYLNIFRKFGNFLVHKKDL